jgi:tripartite-type tricarboxylate transporter receptor subunit TctC
MASLRLIALIGLVLAPLASHAQSYPIRPIRVILSVPAGATPDVTARLITPGMSQILGQQLVVDNRPGGGGVIGAEIASKAAPDGYTVFISSPGALTILPHLRKDVPYDTLRDFAPVSLISIGPFVLITHPALPAKSVKELIAAGNGVANHLAMELFKQMAGVDIVHVPYKGAPQAVTDVLSGNMNMMFNSIAPIVGHIKAGRVRVLGIASPKRSSQLPDVPTISEAGVPGFEAVNWFGMFVPAKTPKAIIARLNEAVVKVLHNEDIRAQYTKLGADAAGSTPEAFGAFVRRDMEQYAKVVKISGAKLD